MKNSEKTKTASGRGFPGRMFLFRADCSTSLSAIYHIRFFRQAEMLNL